MSKKHDIEILIMLRDDIKTLRKTFAKIFVWNKHENYDNVLCYVKYFMLNCFNHIVTIFSQKILLETNTKIMIMFYAC